MESKTPRERLKELHDKHIRPGRWDIDALVLDAIRLGFDAGQSSMLGPGEYVGKEVKTREDFLRELEK